MADYIRIETSNQAVTGTAAGEMFELIPSNNALSNIIINAAGGNDTIKVSGSNVEATIMNLDPSSFLDLPGSNYYYSIQADGINITDDSLNLKLLGTTNTAVFANSNASFTSLDQYTTANGEWLRGTGKNDNIVINHSNCTAEGGAGDDFVIAYGDDNYLDGGEHNDTVITTGNNNMLYGGNGYYGALSYDNNVIIVGGSNNHAQGSHENDTFEIYSYTASGSNNTLTSGSAYSSYNGYNTYILSTGLVGVDGAQVGTAAYNPYTSDTVNVTITDARSGDSYYMRDWGNFGIYASTTSDGVAISSTDGRINILMAGQRDWNAVKDNLITLDNAQGLVATYTLEQAAYLGGSNTVAVPTTSATPAGISVAGDYLNVSSAFIGNLIMSSSLLTYLNDGIITIDATQNYQAGMLLGGNVNANLIHAGQGGNVVWGGEGFTTSDYLFSGAGSDVFLVGKSDGNDTILNTGINDAVSLYDVSLSDIVGFAQDANTISLGLSSGNVISVATSDVLSPVFQVATGQSYRFNRATGSWQGA